MQYGGGGYKKYRICFYLIFFEKAAKSDRKKEFLTFITVCVSFFWVNCTFFNGFELSMKFCGFWYKDRILEHIFLLTLWALLKGTQAWHFFYFFAETETIWSQGPVTRDFWKSYSTRPRYSTFKNISAHTQHAMKSVPRMLSMWWNSFRVCSVCDKIHYAYTQNGLNM